MAYRIRVRDGLVFLVAGYALGVDRFCKPNAGNLCGLAGVFGTGPLGFAAGSLGYALLFRWLRRTQKQG